MSFYSFMRKVVRFSIGGFYKINVFGLENVPEENFLVCSNHVAFFDPFLIALPVKPRLYFMAKAELFKIPVVKTIITKLGAFPISRGKASTEPFDRSAALLSEGKCVGIFPEGTRSRSGEPMAAKSGAAYIAYHSQTLILPVSIRFEHKHRFRSGINLTYGKPFPYTQLCIEKPSSSAFRDGSKLIMDRITEQFYATDFPKKNGKK